MRKSAIACASLILVLILSSSVPAFAQSPRAPSICSVFHKANAPGSDAFFGGICATPMGHGGTITGGTANFTLPTAACSGTCNGFFVGLLAAFCQPNGLCMLAVGAFIRVNQGGDFIAITGANGAGQGPTVYPGDRVTAAIVAIQGGYAGILIDQTTGVRQINTVATTSPISFLYYGVLTVCGDCPAPAPMQPFGTITFTNATMDIGNRQVPLAATDVVPFTMVEVLTSPTIQVTNIVLVQPTRVTGSSFTLVQSNNDVLIG